MRHCLVVVDERCDGGEAPASDAPAWLCLVFVASRLHTLRQHASTAANFFSASQRAARASSLRFSDPRCSSLFHTWTVATGYPPRSLRGECKRSEQPIRIMTLREAVPIPPNPITHYLDPPSTTPSPPSSLKSEYKSKVSP